MKIYYTPSKLSNNQFAKINIEIISDIENCTVEDGPHPKDILRSPLKYFFSNKADIIILNWFENFLVNKEGQLTFNRIVAFFLYFLAYRISGKKLIYVRHNLYPHKLFGKSAKVAQKLVNFVEHFCSNKASLSGHLCDKGYKYIPHPLYKKSFQIPHNDKEYTTPYYIIFGNISPYKGINLIIKNWGNHSKLLVAGTVKDPSYLKDLKNIASKKNIEFLTDYIPEDYAANLIYNSSGVIISHTGNEMIVSGSFFHAITFGTPVYSLVTPFYTWLNSTYDFPGLFCFNSHRELVNALPNSPISLEQRTNIRQMAEQLFGYSSVKLAWEQLLFNHTN